MTLCARCGRDVPTPIGMTVADFRTAPTLEQYDEDGWAKWLENRMTLHLCIPCFDAFNGWLVDTSLRKTA